MNGSLAMTGPAHGRDRAGGSERRDQVESGPPAAGRAGGRGLSVVVGADQARAAAVAVGGITPEQAELLGDHNLYNG